MTDETILTVENLDAYYGSFQALFGVSLDVKKGEIVSLIGANGAGKTTTLSCVTGLVRPAAGSIMYKGKDLSKLPTHEIINMGVSQVPEGRGIFPLLSVRENLYLGAYTKRSRLGRDKMIERVYELFPILSERQNQMGGSLSGGEQQMLAIGRGLMSDPELMLMDEVSLGLAPIVIDRIYKTIEKINSGGVTILFVEQNVRRSLQESDRSYVMKQGRITLHGTADTLKEEAEIKKAYFGLEA
ncbi:MAG TPA: ABC transporter ATP-binding protein [Nitrososphaerales archaeon]|nr:ABC transporter ATP-binding protein [Nitrososphaerales archaeon]